MNQCDLRNKSMPQIEKHGGELETIAEKYGIDANSLLDFSVNVNPLGPPASLSDAVKKGFALLNRYPDSSSRRMRRKLAHHLNLSSENIIIGSGATELIYLISRCWNFSGIFSHFNPSNPFLDWKDGRMEGKEGREGKKGNRISGEVACEVKQSHGTLPQKPLGLSGKPFCMRSEHTPNVVIVAPTFSDYQRSVSLVGGRVRHHLLSSETCFHLDMDRLIADAVGSDILFLCNPNNPTGQLFQKSQIIALTETFKNTLIVVDEAFLDFTEEPNHNSVCGDVINFPNLIVLRSMTKLFAIPGLRLGYLIANQNLVERLNQYKEPWTVNTFAQIAGEMFLNEIDYIRKTRELVKTERKFLFKQLKQLHWLTPFPSTVNFLLIQIRQRDLAATILKEKLIEKGILIRNCSNFVGLDESFFRIAVKKHEDNLRLIGALQAI